MIDIVSTVRPSVVFHLASLFLARHQPEDIGPLITSNVLFSTQLLEATAMAGCQCFINTGTAWQHFESRAYDPVCLYAATKQAFEQILAFYVNTTALRAVTLKLFDTYGPGDPRPKLFGLLQRTASEGGVLEMSPGEQQMDIVHIDDVVPAFAMAAERLLRGEGAKMETFAVSAGQTRSLKEVVETYRRVVSPNLQVRWGGRPYRPREVMVPWTGGVPVPGWAPRISLEEGLRTLG